MRFWIDFVESSGLETSACSTLRLLLYFSFSEKMKREFVRLACVTISALFSFRTRLNVIWEAYTSSGRELSVDLEIVLLYCAVLEAFARY